MPIHVNAVSLFLCLATSLFILVFANSSEGQSIGGSPPPKDSRTSTNPKTLDTLRKFRKPASLAAWKRERAKIRERVLVSCGLSPMPFKPPLNAIISGKIDRDGYSVEKVSIQTYSGFYLAGNLYRPSGVSHSEKKHPGVLVTHGHWAEGRMADSDVGSIPARAIAFARQGYIAFSYDMAGYNDTKQIEHRTFAASDRHWLWGISLMGLQTWNSIRALDFLCSLKEVDQKKLVITGESGGGTQTMMLGAIDDRLAAVAPCVMVSHSMQGGCLCENAPGLRIDYSNMEIAAAAAPKPQIMVGASGDWTRTMMTIEGPAVKRVYDLYGKPDELSFQLFQFNHNINKTSREAVYKFLGEKLLQDDDASHFAEPPYKMEPVSDLRVFPDGSPLPENAITSETLVSNLIEAAKSDLESYDPHDYESLKYFKATFSPIWELTLAIDFPANPNMPSWFSLPEKTEGGTATRGAIGRKGKGDSIPSLLLKPTKISDRCVIIVHPKGISGSTDAEGKPIGLAKNLLKEGFNVFLFDAFLTGTRADAALEKSRRLPFGEFFTTYNRTDLQERVQDLITCGAFLRLDEWMSSVQLIGIKEAGLWALLASPAFDGTVADCNSTDLTNDDAMLTPELYAPCLRKMGDFGTAGILASSKPLLLHNEGSKFPASLKIVNAYKVSGSLDRVKFKTSLAEDKEIIQWMTHRK